MKAWMLNVWTHDIVHVPNSVCVNSYLSERQCYKYHWIFSVMVRHCGPEKTKPVYRLLFCVRSQFHKPQIKKCTSVQCSLFSLIRFNLAFKPNGPCTRMKLSIRNLILVFSGKTLLKSLFSVFILTFKFLIERSYSQSGFS